MRRALATLIAALVGCSIASAGTARPRTVVASYEGLVGYRDACGGRVNTTTRGLASHYRCGTRITLRYGRHVVHAVTTDHGPYVYGRSLDLWTATVRGLGFRSGAAFGVRRVVMVVGR